MEHVKKNPFNPFNGLFLSFIIGCIHKNLLYPNTCWEIDDCFRLSGTLYYIQIKATTVGLINITFRRSFT
ncbi:hypothetical protein CBFG_01344 [Clostridiales bacterium 1_7_47FAA]|nr:hypothetical protein CBFG_01344 [Clostridiales bacterium 1_7_47FAA]